MPNSTPTISILGNQNQLLGGSPVQLFPGINLSDVENDLANWNNAQLVINPSASGEIQYNYASNPGVAVSSFFDSLLADDNAGQTFTPFVEQLVTYDFGSGPQPVGYFTRISNVFYIDFFKAGWTITNPSTSASWTAAAVDSTVVEAILQGLTYFNVSGALGDWVPLSLAINDYSNPYGTVTDFAYAFDNLNVIINDVLLVNDAASTTIGTAIDIDVLANDTILPSAITDIDDASVVALNGVVTVTVGAGGHETLHYVPDPGFVGTDTIYYNVYDGNGQIQNAEVSVTVTNPSNADPVVTGPRANLPVGAIDQPYTVTSAELLEGISDPDGDPVSVANLTCNHGSVADNHNGTFTVTPDTAYGGLVTLSYDIVDGVGGSLATSLDFLLSPATTTLDFSATGIIADFDGDPLTPDAHAQSIIFSDLSVPGGEVAETPAGPTIAASQFTANPALVDTIIGTAGSDLFTVFFPLHDLTIYGGNSNDFMGFGMNSYAHLIRFDGQAGDNQVSIYQGYAAPIDMVIDFTLLDPDGYAAVTLTVDPSISPTYGTQTVGYVRNVSQFFSWIYGGDDLINASTLTANLFFALGDGDDTASGGGGDDTFYASHGNDSYDGGGGLDTVSYFNEFGYHDLTVDLSQTVNGYASATYWRYDFSTNTEVFETDLLANFENILGTTFGTGIDTLTGNAAANRFETFSGNDILDGKAGMDHLDAGIGDDIITGGADGDEIIGGDGFDTADFSGSAQAVNVNLTTGAGHGGDAEGDTYSGIEKIIGSGQSDTLTGDAGINELAGGGGADNLDGKAGLDILSGGLGNDFYYIDVAEVDTINEIDGEGDGDRILANGTFALAAGLSIEVLSTTSNAGTDSINLTGNEHVNMLIGNAGNNVLDGGAGGGDSAYGLGGDDTYIVDHALDRVYESAGNGVDRVRTTVSYTLLANQEIEILSAYDPAGAAAITLNGNNLGNTLEGNNGANTLDGRAGADSLYGFDGNDNYFVDNAADQVFESVNQGSDRIFASVSWTLGDNQQVEILSTTSNAGTAAINLTGNNIGNIIYGNAGINMLDGGAGGGDSLYGLGGNDTYIVDHATDKVYETAGAGTDTVRASVTYSLMNVSGAQEVEILTTTNQAGTTAINLTGNNITNTVEGNNGANVLDGRGGADSLYGFDGNDSYYVDNALDQVFEDANKGSDRVFASVSWVLADNQSVETLSTTNNAGTGAIDLTGNNIVNFIYGNAGSNTINGKAGNDILYGLGGADNFVFDTALNPTTNVDRIADFAHSSDKIHLDDAIFSALPAGALAGASFQDLALGAAGATDTVIYDSINGRLYYDADGGGGNPMVLFAILIGNPTLTESDFLVF